VVCPECGFEIDRYDARAPDSQCPLCGATLRDYL